MLRKLPLWLIGIFLVVFAVLIPVVFGTPNFAGSAYEQGEATGQVIVQLASFLAGVTLIVVHLIRWMRTPKKPKRPDCW